MVLLQAWRIQKLLHGILGDPIKTSISMWQSKPLPSSPWKGNVWSCESEAKAAMETPVSQRYQGCRMPAKGSHRQRVELARVSGHMHYSWQSQEQGCLNPLEFTSYHCVPNAAHEATELSICSAGFPSWFGQIPSFFLWSYSSHLEWECLSYATECYKYVTC